ncbi:hypothetical protein QQF64_018566 [Cirrhinus molitorella]|uniref:Uncharacterized protein n=1 Tax=Cirrhinus molitorella TaxID=172907 RepID=A0ABR3LEF8_9TELE
MSLNPSPDQIALLIAKRLTHTIASCFSQPASQALRSNPSHLRELDLSANKPGDSGVNLLCALLEDPHCKLEKLRLRGCSIEEEGCAALISALRSNSSHLRELDLSGNKPGDSGLKLRSALLNDPDCKLEKLHI